MPRQLSKHNDIPDHLCVFRVTKHLHRNLTLLYVSKHTSIVTGYARILLLVPTHGKLSDLVGLSGSTWNEPSPPGYNQDLSALLQLQLGRVSIGTRLSPTCLLASPLKVLSPKDCHPNMTRFIKGLEPSCLLLETDAPYFGLHSKDYPKGAPSQVFAVAKQVAEWCNSTPGTVLWDSTVATYQFYRL